MKYILTPILFSLLLILSSCACRAVANFDVDMVFEPTDTVEAISE
ncbi:MAG: hypothetical protein PQJ44_07065 [Sphaerochaetaceae bacterium]|nr:hypothetical protein [Sphaerochaetaceae bacterium]